MLWQWRTLSRSWSSAPSFGAGHPETPIWPYLVVRTWVAVCDPGKRQLQLLGLLTAMWSTSRRFTSRRPDHVGIGRRAQVAVDLQAVEKPIERFAEVARMGGIPSA